MSHFNCEHWLNKCLILHVTFQWWTWHWQWQWPYLNLTLFELDPGHYFTSLNFTDVHWTVYESNLNRCFRRIKPWVTILVIAWLYISEIHQKVFIYVYLRFKTNSVTEKKIWLHSTIIHSVLGSESPFF